MSNKNIKERSNKGQESARRLMVTAVDLFSEHNYSFVTIKDITKKAGVAHSLVYYHFINKEDLFDKAITNLIKTTIKSYQKSRTPYDNPVGLIESWFENNIRLAPDLRKLVKIMFNYAGPNRGLPSVAKFIHDFYREEHKILADNIQKGISDGYFKVVDPHRVATFISTHIDGIFYDTFIRNDSNIEPAMRDLKWALWSMLDYGHKK